MSTPAKRTSLVRQTVAQIAAQAHERPDLGFDPSASRWHQRAIFVTGAPRSGTSWLHQMLLTHPDVATGGEMHVFCEGFAAVFANFDDPDPYMNLSTWVTRSQLVGLSRDFIDGVFSAAADASRPDAEWVLDKTPNHRQCARFLAEVYPDATFVQIIRNPRDAISSARDLWSEWDPRLRDARNAAADWCATVTDCRTHLSALHYIEVQYESLLAEPIVELTRILDAVGLRHDADYVEQVVDFGKAPVNVRPSDPRISTAKWAGADPVVEQEIVEVAGELMEELGYLDAGERAAITARRPIARTAVTVARSTRGSVRRLTRAAAHSPGQLAQRVRGRQSSSAVMAVAQRLIDAASRSAESDIIALLTPSVVLTHPDGTTTEGSAAVARELSQSLRAAQAIPVAADEHAAVVELVRADATRQNHRYYTSRGTITRIVVEGGGG